MPAISTSTRGSRWIARSSRMPMATTPAGARGSTSLPPRVRGVLRTRLGPEAAIETVALRRDGRHQRRERLAPSGGAHPGLGADPGRARGEVWVVSGDYKTEPDPTCTPFEPVRATCSSPRSTFGLPIYRWAPQDEVFDEMRDVVARRTATPGGRASSSPTRWARRSGCSRGWRRGDRADLHARRGRAAEPGLSRGGRRARRHAATRRIAARARLRGQPDRGAAVGGGQHMAPAIRRRLDRRSRRDGCASAARAGAARSTAASCCPTTSTGPALLAAIEATGAERVRVTHGFREPVVRWLREHGIEASKRSRATGRARKTPTGVDGRGRGDPRVRRFARLFSALDETTRTNEKVEAMVGVLRGGRPPRTRRGRSISSAADGRSGSFRCGASRSGRWTRQTYPSGCSRNATKRSATRGDDRAAAAGRRRRRRRCRCTGWVDAASAAARDAARRRSSARDRTRAWRELRRHERFVWNKLITGGFRVGVSQQLVVRALAKSAGSTKASIAHRLIGHWEPTAESFAALVAARHERCRPSRVRIRSIWPIRSRASSRRWAILDEWQAEWKWDGIRAQLIRRDGQTFIWTRGEELVTERFPELAAAADACPTGR